MLEIDKVRGALLGEVCGDALGYPMKTLTTGKIIRRFGPFGLRTMITSKNKKAKALVSDSTQMMLATVDGLLWSDAKKLSSSDGVYRGLCVGFIVKPVKNLVVGKNLGQEDSRMKKTYA